jgi:two-component system, NarL family, sensor kinase
VPLTSGPLGMKAEATLRSAWLARGLLLGVRARVLLVVLTSILLMLGFAAALALNLAKVEEQAIAHRVQLAARTTAHAVDLEIAAAEALLSGLATSPSLQGGDLQSFYQQVTSSARPAGSRILLYDLNGAQLINTFHPFGVPLPGPRELPFNVETIRSGQPQVSNLVVGRITGDRIVGVLVPVRRGPAIPYVLAMSIPPPSLGRILQKLPDGLIGTVVDGAGAVIISNRLGSRDVGQLIGAELQTAAEPDALGLRPGMLRGGEATVWAVARSTVSPWLVVIELPKAVLAAPRRSAWLLIGASALVFGVCGLLLAPVASRGIVSLFEALRKAADKAAREKDDVETLYRTYFDSTTESLFIVQVTPDGRFLFKALNPVHERLTGLSTAAIIGKEPRECLAPEAAAWVTGNYRRCVEGGVPIRYDEVLTLPGGTRAWETALVPVRDPATGRICRIVGSARDITERRSMFEALRESEERFRAMAETVPDILYVSDPHGRCIYVNARYYEFTGLRFGAVAGTGWLDAIHPKDVPAVMASMRGGASDELIECEFRMRSAEGGYRWFVGRSRPIQDAHGRVVRWFGTATDVDDLKQAQAALLSTNQRLRTILSSISDGYYAIDRSWRFIDVNEQAASWAGLSPEAMIGRPIMEIFPNTSVVDYIRQVMGRESPIHVEAPSTFKSGRWIDLHVYPSPEGVSVFFRDITRRKQAELAALENQDLLQSTMDALSAHIAIIDSSGVILTVNAAWRRFAEATGTQMEDAGIGANYFQVCGVAGPACADKDAVATGLRAIMRGEHAEFRFDYPCKCGGEQRWFQLRATRFGDGDMMRLVLAHENITEIMQAEQALRRLAGRLLRTQDEERRRIARDLHDSTAQNLLGAALGIERALRLAPNLTERAKGALADSQTLIEQSQQEIRTVSYLLHPPMLDEMGLPSALRWYMEGFTRRSGIAVEISIAPAIEGRRFPFDVEAALFRVLQECMTNVHRHSGSNTAWIELTIESVSPRAGRLALRVEDRGKGMLVAARDRAPTAAANESGVVSIGVGLAGMRERLRQLGGNLEIWSSPRGTTVRASVPVESGSETASSTKLAPATPA